MRAIGQAVDADAGWHRRTQAWQGGTNGVDGGYDVGTRLFGNGQHDGAVVADGIVSRWRAAVKGPGSEFAVFRPIHRDTDVTHPDRCAIAPCQHHGAPLLRLEQLVIGIHVKGLPFAINGAGRLVHGGDGDDATDVLKAQAQGLDLFRVDLYPHRRLLRAKNIHQAHALYA